MTQPQNPLIRHLRRDQFLRFEQPRGLCLRAERGALWVTIDGEPDDITIEAGASRTFEGGAGVLVGTFRDEAVLWARPRREAARWRRWLGFDPLAPGRAA